MNSLWLEWALAALFLGFAVACGAAATTAARGAGRRRLDWGGVRGWHPRGVPRQLRGAAAVAAGGLVAFGAGACAVVAGLGLLGLLGVIRPGV